MYRSIEKQSRRCIVEKEESCLLHKWLHPNAKQKYQLHMKSSFSDTESFYNPKPGCTGFPKPSRIRVRPGRTEERATTLFYERRELRVIDDYRFRSSTDEKTPKPKPKSKSTNLKKPSSPGGRLASFLNSIFTGTPKKSKNPSSVEPITTQRGSRSVPSSTCSSASSFSRSCLTSREKLRDGVKRSVRFCPVSVIAAETGPIRETEVKVEELARDFMNQYRENQKVRNGYAEIDEDGDDDDDDDESCASSDLFELDHLAVMGGDRYREELPVYETTRFDRRQAVSNRREF